MSRGPSEILLEVGMRIVAAALTALVVSALPARGQTPYNLNPDTERIQQHYRRGWEAFLAERWSEAVGEFKQVLAIDAKHKLAYYGLGRSYMQLKQFVDATTAYEECRTLYESDASEKFKSAQEADTIRQNDLDQIRIAITALSTRSPNTATPTTTSNQLRQLRDQAQRIQNKRDAINNNLSIVSEVPSFVWLALGSAYLRSSRFPDAEKAYKTTIDLDPKSGEAWNNLAALYLMMDRIEDADKAATSAEKVGYAVNPGLKADIKRRKSGA
jgi:tetratricopeptide (TPR) repeat protein